MYDQRHITNHHCIWYFTSIDIDIYGAQLCTMLYTTIYIQHERILDGSSHKKYNRYMACLPHCVYTIRAYLSMVYRQFLYLVTFECDIFDKFELVRFFFLISWSQNREHIFRCNHASNCIWLMSQKISKACKIIDLYRSDHRSIHRHLCKPQKLVVISGTS